MSSLDSLVLALVIAFASFGIGAMSLNPPEYSLANVFFTFGFLVIIGRMVWWTIFQQHKRRSLFYILSIVLVIVLISACLYVIRTVNCRAYKQEEAIRPLVGARIYPSPMQSFNKYPSFEYILEIKNLKPEASSVVDYRAEFYFRNKIEKIISMPLIETGADDWVGLIKTGRNWLKPDYEEQPVDTVLAKEFSLNVKQAKINGKLTNTNVLLFNCRRWPERAFFRAHIYVDLSEEEKNRQEHDKRGTFEGTYFFQNRNNIKPITFFGLIPVSDKDMGKMNFERSFWLANPKEGVLFANINDEHWLERNNGFVEFIPYMKKTGLELHIYRDTDNIFKVLIKTPYHNAVILKYGNLDKIKQNPTDPEHIVSISWGEHVYKLYIDDILVDRYPKTIRSFLYELIESRLGCVEQQ